MESNDKLNHNHFLLHGVKLFELLHSQKEHDSNALEPALLNEHDYLQEYVRRGVPVINHGHRQVPSSSIDQAQDDERPTFGRYLEPEKETNGRMNPLNSFPVYT